MSTPTQGFAIDIYDDNEVAKYDAWLKRQEEDRAIQQDEIDRWRANLHTQGLYRTLAKQGHLLRYLQDCLDKDVDIDRNEVRRLLNSVKHYDR